MASCCCSSGVVAPRRIALISAAAAAAAAVVLVLGITVTSVEAYSVSNTFSWALRRSSACSSSSSSGSGSHRTNHHGGSLVASIRSPCTTSPLFVARRLPLQASSRLHSSHDKTYGSSSSVPPRRGAAVTRQSRYSGDQSPLFVLSSSSSNDAGNDDAEVYKQTTPTPIPSPLLQTTSSSSNNNNTATTGVTMSLLQRIDQWGQRLKPMALQARKDAKAVADKKQGASLLFAAKSCVLFALFIVYRAYRGCFVLLPAIFSQVYAQLSESMDSPFGLISDDSDNNMNNNNNGKDINPNTGKVRLRTVVMVSAWALLVTLSYVVAGGMRVFMKFVSTVTKTSNVSSSFEAAADELISNEASIQKLTQKGGTSNKKPKIEHRVNGSDGTPDFA